MVPLRYAEEAETYFPREELSDKASSSSSRPFSTSDPRPIPLAAKKGGITLGTTGYGKVDVTGINQAEPAAIQTVTSGSPVVIRFTVPVAEDQSDGKVGQPYKVVARKVTAFRPGIGVLPPRRRIATKYEPHLRRRTIESLSELFERLRKVIGRPETAARVFSLRRFMAAAYRESALSSETRDFASAISLLQDFLSPHWSEISAEKIEEVTQTLDWLRSLPRITARELEILHRKLSLVLGGLSIEIPDDEEESSAIGQ